MDFNVKDQLGVVERSVSLLERNARPARSQLWGHS